MSCKRTAVREKIIRKEGVVGMIDWLTRVRAILKGKKSYIIAAAAILAKLSGYLDGELNEGEFLNAILPWLAVMAGRAALAKGVAGPEPEKTEGGGG